MSTCTSAAAYCTNKRRGNGKERHTVAQRVLLSGSGRNVPYERISGDVSFGKQHTAPTKSSLFLLRTTIISSIRNYQISRKLDIRGTICAKDSFLQAIDCGIDPETCPLTDLVTQCQPMPTVQPTQNQHPTTACTCQPHSVAQGSDKALDCSAQQCGCHCTSTCCYSTVCLHSHNPQP